jgi:hypothetical protein
MERRLSSSKMEIGGADYLPREMVGDGGNDDDDDDEFMCGMTPAAGDNNGRTHRAKQTLLPYPYNDFGQN